MISYQLTTGAIGLITALFIVILVRKDFLYTRYSLWWLGVAACVMLFGVFPRLADWLAVRLGVAYAPSLVFIGALGFILIKMLTMDIERSRQEIVIRRLVQRIGLLEARLRENWPDAPEQEAASGEARPDAGGGGRETRP